MGKLIDRMIGPAAARLFEGVSRLRGKRSLHPDGVGFEGSLHPIADQTGAEILDGDPRSVIVRLSRSIGLPEPLPEPLGIALRVPEAYGPGLHQDLLLVSTGRAIGLRHVLRPANDFTAPHYSTIAPYRLSGSQVLLGATASGAPASRTTLGEIADQDGAGLRIELRLSGFRGDWRRVAVVELGARLPDEFVEGLRFDPANTGGGLQLVGAVNRLRGPAYARSQRGRGAPLDRGAPTKLIPRTARGRVPAPAPDAPRR